MPKINDKVIASITYTATWKKNLEPLNEVPTIQAEDKIITVGDAFDPMKDVTASDTEDGDLTTKLEIVKNSVNTEKVGKYEVTYKVADSKGASTTKTIKVTVKNKKFKTDISKAGTDKSNKGTSSVETGDRTNISFYASLFVMWVVCKVILVAWKKKKVLRNR